MQTSNFEFMKFHGAKLYNSLKDFEGKIILEPFEAGEKLRVSLEMFAVAVIEEKRLKESYNSYLKNNDRTDNLATKLRFLEENRVLPNYEISTEYMYDGKKTTRFLKKDYYRGGRFTILYYLRTFGNQFHHAESGDFNSTNARYVCNYYHMLDCAILLYEYLLEYYKVSSNPSFDIKKVPIVLANEQSRFEITGEIKSRANIILTNCKSEYTAKYYSSDDNDTSYYAILQFFSKKDKSVSPALMSRCAKTYSVTRRSLFGEAIREIKVVSSLSAESDFYILAYIFEQEAQPLSEKLLKQIPIKERLNICYGIAAIMCDLHSAKPPIYHRLLNYSCIYLCKNDIEDDAWQPAIIKFNVAKINKDSVQTVVQDATKKSISAIKENALAKYIPEDWESNASEHGDEIDVYSLGMLFYDILCAEFDSEIARGSIDDHRDRIEQRLTAAGADDDTVLLILDMIDTGFFRIKLNDAIKTLDDIISRG